MLSCEAAKPFRASRCSWDRHHDSSSCGSVFPGRRTLWEPRWGKHSQSDVRFRQCLLAEKGKAQRTDSTDELEVRRTGTGLVPHLRRSRVNSFPGFTRLSQNLPIHVRTGYQARPASEGAHLNALRPWLTGRGKNSREGCRQFLNRTKMTDDWKGSGRFACQR